MKNSCNQTHTMSVRPDDLSFDASILPFSRKLSYLYIKEFSTDSRKEIGIYRSQKKYLLEGDAKCPVLLKLIPVENENYALYSCRANPSMIKVETSQGSIQAAFDNANLLRIESDHQAFQIHINEKECQNTVLLPDGACLLAFDPIGTLLLKPIRGSMKTICQHENTNNASRYIKFDPDDDGKIDIAIHYHIGIAQSSTTYRPFIDCVQEAWNDYLDWLSMYPPVLSEYEYVKNIAVYSVWSCYTAPTGVLTDPLIFYSKDYSALSWHSSYHAYAMSENVDMSVRTLLSVFNYQDEHGQLPDMIDDQYINMLATKPPIQGYVLTNLIKIWKDKFERSHAEMLYPPFKKLYNWWMTMRDSDHNGIPQYNQGCECGMDFTEMLKDGTPVECPDLITYMILMARSLEILTDMIGLDEECTFWKSEQDRLLKVLITEFWDGDKFIARLSTTHEIVDFDEAERLIPILLGNLLPNDIITKIARDLKDPKQYYTYGGFRTATPTDPDRPTGVIMDFTQIRIIPGLLETNERALGLQTLENFCRLNLEKYPRFGYMEKAADGSMEEDIFEKVDFSNIFSALSSSTFLVMASILFREKNRAMGGE